VQQLGDANAQRDDLRATGTALAARLAEATARADEAEARPTLAATAAVALVAASISLLAGLGLGWVARHRTAQPAPALGVPASEPLD
jgi:ABC-type sulfate transport system permease component